MLAVILKERVLARLKDDRKNYLPYKNVLNRLKIYPFNFKEVN